MIEHRFVWDPRGAFERLACRAEPKLELDMRLQTTNGRRDEDSHDHR